MPEVDVRIERVDVAPGDDVLMHSVLKGGGARKMFQTAKTFVTKLVRYIEWIVDPL